ncbi:PIN domain protein [Lentisphaera araneosa HTCC2155]|jgi:predicted nucleic acid-binding protein|uniref:PIN domain protein n=1 Tax=Lentisphaera araneosa HTCC2155 TaxID=313628 RepID=A6DKG6_9BACT|nr:PIN domain-containing protein [Lentisphaera araneosa]EDM27864.1 PIN domain protein [Lentisphaera araneosa HTCC2155]
MIHAFIDCDVIIDLLTRREPHFKESALLFQSALDKQIKLFTSPLAIANVHYMVKKSKDEQQTRNAISKLLTIIEIADMTKSTVIKALNSDMKDFEDALQSYTAEPLACDYIITRNTKDYKKALLEAKTPTEINQIIQ